MTFYETLTAAINDIIEHGFDSQERVDRWVNEIRAAAVSSLTPPNVLEEALISTFGTIYTRMVEGSGLQKMNPDVSTFTISRVKPKLRQELDRRRMASHQLIKLNREKAIEAMNQRFFAWATSVPDGGTEAADRADIKKTVKKSLASLPFEERRVLIDQGHKFTATLNDIVAKDAGAIAAKWKSHWREPHYNYRKDHKERDGKIYLIRDSWAHEKGLVKPGEAGYFDKITQPGEEVYCRCAAQYIYSVGKLPEDMLTDKGLRDLAEVRQKLA